MRLVVFGISVLAILASSCDRTNPDQKKQGAAASNGGGSRPPLSSFERDQKKQAAAASDGAKNAIVDRLVEKYGANAQPVGRYQMFARGAKILKLDTTTGQTWALEGSVWKPLKTEPVTDPSDPLGICAGQAGSPPKSAEEHGGGMIKVQLPDGRTGEIHSTRKDDFLKAYPGAKVLSPPPIGAVEDGYRFKGGDPSKRENWELVKR